jgi:hypothetical protein
MRKLIVTENAGVDGVIDLVAGAEARRHAQRTNSGRPMDRLAS